MGDKHGPIPAGGVSVLLLDSAQGKPIQTWRFTDQTEITIGREDGRDIVISDPHVSRHHVTLVATDDDWMLISCGRHGTLIDNRLVAEAPLRSGVVFRLGPDRADAAVRPGQADHQHHRHDGSDRSRRHRHARTRPGAEPARGRQDRRRRAVRRIAADVAADAVGAERSRSERSSTGVDLTRFASRTTSSIRRDTLGQDHLDPLVPRRHRQIATPRPTSPCSSPAPAIASASSTPTSSRPASTSSFSSPSRASSTRSTTTCGASADRGGGLRRDRRGHRQRRPDAERPRVFLIPSSVNVGEIGRVLREGYDVAKLNDGFQRLIQRAASSTTCSSTRIPASTKRRCCRSPSPTC